MKGGINEKIIYFHPKLPKKIDNKSISNFNNNSNNNINNIQQNLTSKFLLTKKINLFKVEKFEEDDPNEDKTPKKGRWTLKEHIQFLQALDKFGMKWKKVKKIIKTRTTNQIISHCQKFFIRLKNCKDEELGIDFTLDNIRNMDDIINHIKSVNKNFDVVNVLLYISGKYTPDSNTKKSNIIKKAFDVNYIFDKEIKSNTNNSNNEINFDQAFNINEFNKLIEETGKEQQLINKNFYNNINAFRQNFNCINFNFDNIIYNYINNSIIMNYINNINNNIILGNNFQNLNNLDLYNSNQQNSLNSKISNLKSIIDNNNINESVNITNTKN